MVSLLSVHAVVVLSDSIVTNSSYTNMLEYPIAFLYTILNIKDQR